MLWGILKEKLLYSKIKSLKIHSKMIQVKVTASKRIKILSYIKDKGKTDKVNNEEKVQTSLCVL